MKILVVGQFEIIVSRRANRVNREIAGIQTKFALCLCAIQ